MVKIFLVIMKFKKRNAQRNSYEAHKITICIQRSSGSLASELEAEVVKIYNSFVFVQI
jgi:hypothetical protein